ncbi:MAG TPA: zf-TFIIB domain-containing protein [Candidatus Saccharimonadales bacterium]|nr:zf-TFIIB domain-containing protein [Candidatus Saccharimonadales bacterium]
MKCPLCEGDFEPLDLRADGQGFVRTDRCSQCGGWWFPRELPDSLHYAVVNKYESPQPSYSLKAFDLLCPSDQTLLQQSDYQIAPNGARFWQCPECDGTFFPKGQLSLYAQWKEENLRPVKHGSGYTQIRAASTVSLALVLFVAILASVNRTGLSLSAAETQTLPTTGPNIFTLILLSLTYLAGTVLAVLSRKLPVIIIGWLVIVICLFGFAVIVFGP